MIYLSLRVKRSSQKNDALTNYKNKTEYMNDVRRYIESDTDIENILDYFYDCYLENNSNYNHYKIDYDTFQETINSLNNMHDFIENNYQLKGKTTFGIMLEYVENYFNTKEKHSIKNVADAKTFMIFLTTVYKKNTNCEMFYLPGTGKGRRLKDSLSDVI